MRAPACLKVKLDACLSVIVNCSELSYNCEALTLPNIVTRDNVNIVERWIGGWSRLKMDISLIQKKMKKKKCELNVNQRWGQCDCLSEKKESPLTLILCCLLSWTEDFVSMKFWRYERSSRQLTKKFFLRQHTIALLTTIFSFFLLFFLICKSLRQIWRTSSSSLSRWLSTPMTIWLWPLSLAQSRLIH